jgi:hypothetical protein
MRNRTGRGGWKAMPAVHGLSTLTAPPTEKTMATRFEVGACHVQVEEGGLLR